MSQGIGDSCFWPLLARAARDVEPKLKAVPALTTDTDDEEEEE